ncbi:MAG: hypothetical protein ACLGI9_08165 [Thermoanaerobaculia bacterium]
MARSARSIGMTLLGIYLVLAGLVQFIAIPSSGLILAILALAAGILILLGR